MRLRGVRLIGNDFLYRRGLFCRAQTKKTPPRARNRPFFLPRLYRFMLVPLSIFLARSTVKNVKKGHFNIYYVL